MGLIERIEKKIIANLQKKKKDLKVEKSQEDSIKPDKNVSPVFLPDTTLDAIPILLTNEKIPALDKEILKPTKEKRSLHKKAIAKRNISSFAKEIPQTDEEVSVTNEILPTPEKELTQIQEEVIENNKELPQSQEEILETNIEKPQTQDDVIITNEIFPEPEKDPTQEKIIEDNIDFPPVQVETLESTENSIPNKEEISSSREALIALQKQNSEQSEITTESKLENPIPKEEFVNPAPEDNSPKVDVQQNKSSSRPKYSLQFKMMTVISIVIAFTVSTIIAIATYFFKKDYRIRIQESNLELVRVVNSKVLTDLLSQIDKGKQLALTLKQEFKSSIQKQFFIDQYFQNDDSFIYLAVYQKDGTSMKVVDQIFNQEFLKKISLSEEDVTLTIRKNLPSFAKSFSGQPVVLNTSPGFQETSIGLSIPANEGENSELILVILIRLEKIQNAFKKTGPTTTYMVNGEGVVIAHSDPSYVLSAKNLMTTPIVRSMLTSPLVNGNGQESFEDTDGKTYLGSYMKLGLANMGIISTVNEDAAFAEVYRIQKTNILIMIISLCVSLIIIYVFAKSISSPVWNLLEETIKISKGIFKLDIKRTTNDEIGVLTDYFKSMAVGLEEREKVKSMLGSMIDPVVVAEGMKDLAALKRGDEKIITAFFSDVAGFSSISEQLNSVQLASLLNEYLSAMTLILKKHEGVLDKYIGDAIVGIFNAPVDIGDHFLKASLASIEMIEKLEDLRQYWVKNNLYTKEAQEMDVRIGLNTGPAKVGFMGTDAMGSYTMMGDTVNLAARLEAAGKDYGVNILISEMVKTKVEDTIFTRELDLVRVKGKNEPVRLYELITTKANVKPNIKEATEMYEEAFHEYLNREWMKAIYLLRDSQKAKGSKDKAAILLIERCESYIKNPPPQNWDGVYTRTHK